MRNMILLMAGSMLFNTVAVDEMTKNTPVDFVIETNDVARVGVASGDEISELLIVYGLEEEESFSWTCTYDNEWLLDAKNQNPLLGDFLVILVNFFDILD